MALPQRPPVTDHPSPGVASSGRSRHALPLLLLATLLFALGPALLKSLMNVADRIGLGESGAISFCNVLFVGNFCAGLVTLAFCGGRRIVRELRSLPRRTKLDLVLGALVSTIHPALLFTALDQTSVINIVLLSRFNGIVYVVAGALFLKTMVGRAEFAGYAVMAIGVGILVFMNNMGLSIRKGDGYVLLATIFFTLTEIISRRVLRHCSIQTYVFFRNSMSAGVFFIIAIYLFGFEHFADAFEGNFWLLMIVYAGVVIVLAQISWLTAIRVVSVKAVANAQLLNPAFSLAFAFILLDEVPNTSQWVVMAIILAGILIPRLSHGRRKPGQVQTMSIDTSLVAR